MVRGIKLKKEIALKALAILSISVLLSLLSGCVVYYGGREVLGEKKSEKDLIQALKDKNPTVRRAAVEALALSRDVIRTNSRSTRWK